MIQLMVTLTTDWDHHKNQMTAMVISAIFLTLYLCRGMYQFLSDLGHNHTGT